MSRSTPEGGAQRRAPAAHGAAPTPGTPEPAADGPRAGLPEGVDVAGVRARQNAAADLGVRALEGLDLAELMQEAASVVARTIDTELVKVVELLPGGQAARLVAGVGWREGLVGRATIAVGHDSAAGYALLSHEPVIVDDLNADPRLVDPPLLLEHGAVSGVSVILHGPAGRAYGVLGAHTRRRRQFTRDDVDFLQSIANVLSAAMQRRHVEDELRRAHAEAAAFAEQLQKQAAELEAQADEAQALTEELAQANERLLHAASEAEQARDAADAARLVERAAGERARRLLAVAAGLSGAATPEDVADVIFRDGLAALGADAGSLAIVPSDAAGAAPDVGAELEIVRTHGYPEPLTEKYRRFRLTPGRPVSDAILARAPRLLTSMADWREQYPEVEDDVAQMGYEAFVAIPVISAGRVLAVISGSFGAPVAFDEGTRTFLATLGEQCGLALERARAFEAERRAREASAFLAEASRLLATSLDYETTLRAVAEAAVPRLGDWCAVDVVRDPTAPTWPPELDRVAIVHRDPEKLAIGATLAARYPTDWSSERGMAAVIRDGTPLFMPDVPDEILVAAARDAEHLALLRRLEFSSVIVVPLLARGRTLGALTLCSTESRRRYAEADLALALDLAQRAALAVDNARLYRDAEGARLAAEEANRGKSQFLATMSHELRTPLNAIAGHVQLLELGIHGPVTDAQRAALARVDRAQHHLLGLINDVLNYARIESGRVEYDVQPVLVADVVRDVRPMVEPQLLAKGLEFDVRLPEDEGRPPIHVWADPEKLAQILLNLLSNAVKFTAATRAGVPGRVTIELTDRPAPGEGSGTGEHVYLRVVDTGSGIPADKLEAIFEPFVQVRSDFARDTGGTGLGLAISRDLARGMGGDLHARSTQGKGSTFTVTLRRVPPADGEPADRRTGEDRRVEEERRGGEDRREG